MILITSIIVAASLGGCFILHRRSDHYLGEAVRVHEKYNGFIDYMASNDTVTITDREGVEHNFKKQTK